MPSLRAAVKLVLLALGLILALPDGRHARAADFPNRPITIIVPYVPGGATDILARIMGEQLRKSLGQNVVVVNKPGAFGILALEELAKGKADGHTLMIGNNTSNVITPLLYPGKMPFKYEDKVQPIAVLADLPALLTVTTTGFEPKTLAELMAFARNNPGKVRYGSVGVGSFPHFDTLLFAKKAGLEMVHMPSKGAGDLVNSMATGDIQMAFLNVASAASMIKAGRLKPLAAVAPQRLADYPDIPTMDEAGFAGIGTLQWLALFGQTGTPKPATDMIFKACMDGLQSAEVQKAFKTADIHAAPSASPAAAGEFMITETAKWKKVIADSNVKLE